MNKIEIRAVRADWSDTIDLAVFVKHLHGGRSVAEPLSFKEHVVGRMVEASLRLQPEEAQRLMDELWDVGVRPTQGKGSAGQLQATNAHLEDMRRLVFDDCRIAR